MLNVMCTEHVLNVMCTEHVLNVMCTEHVLNVMCRWCVHLTGNMQGCMQPIEYVH